MERISDDAVCFGIIEAGSFPHNLALFLGKGALSNQRHPH